MFNHGYYSQYQGVWSWQANGGGHCSDSFETQALGINLLMGRNDQVRHNDSMDLMLQVLYFMGGANRFRHKPILWFCNPCYQQYAQVCNPPH